VGSSKEHLRPVHQAHRDVEPPLHPARVGADKPVRRLREPEPREQLVGAGAHVSARQAVQVALQQQVLASGRVRVDPGPLSDDTDRATDALRVAEDVVARDDRAPCVGPRERRQDLDRGRLPRPVGAEQAEDRPGLDVQIDPVERANALGINRTDANALDVIDRRGRITAGDLARELRLSTGAVTTVIDRLERAGFARRVPDPGDRRRVLLEVTPVVEENARRIYGTVDEAGPLYDDYTDADLELLLRFQRMGRDWLEERLAT